MDMLDGSTTSATDAVTAAAIDEEEEELFKFKRKEDVGVMEVARLADEEIGDDGLRDSAIPSRRMRICFSFKDEAEAR